MVNNKLLELIRDKAGKDCGSLIEDAEAEAGSILGKASETAREMREEAHARVRNEADRIREQKYNAVQHRMNTKRYELKSIAIRNIWREAETTVLNLEKSDEYDGILESLFFECSADVPDNSAVHCSPSDIEKVSSFPERSKRKLILVEDPLVHGGLEFHWPDGNIVLKNTLAHRMSRLKAEGNAELSAILFSSEDDREPS